MCHYPISEQQVYEKKQFEHVSTLEPDHPMMSDTLEAGEGSIFLQNDLQHPWLAYCGCDEGLFPIRTSLGQIVICPYLMAYNYRSYDPWISHRSGRAVGWQ